MKNIKKMMTAVTLMMVLMVGTSFGGVIITGAQDQQPCTEQPNTVKGGVVIMSDITGVIITGLAGVIITGLKDTPVDCGVIITG